MEIVKLEPAIKTYIWAGNKLKKYGKKVDGDKISECWELSFHHDGLSKIASGVNAGKFLKDVALAGDIGKYVETFPFFPVLIKLIDSGDNLSVQVHPSDEYALKNENSYGKTEMWYVIDHDEGSGLYVGLKEDSNKEDIEKSLKDGTILDKLNFYSVKNGDCFFIKSGTIHAIGKGVTLIEIQQNSNLTYRLYDYNRTDANGKKRELHIDKALKVIDYKKYEPIKFKGNLVGKCKYFSSYVYDVKDSSSICASKDSFVSITFLSGNGLVNAIPYNTYDTFFIPAGQKASISGTGRYILTTIER
jgi:mannose-6-phosphate isomerase